MWYTDTFQHVMLVYDFTWKDTMVIVGQTLSGTEHERVFQEARRYANGLHLSDFKYPIGETAVPSRDPCWDYNNNSKIWERGNFIKGLKTGLKARGIL